MLTPTSSESRTSKQIREVESLEKNRLLLTKMVTPPLAGGSSEEKMPD